MTADEWNQKYPVGTNVVYRPLMRGQEFTQTTTRSEAWELGCGASVVLIKGIAGGVSLRALTVEGSDG